MELLISMLKNIMMIICGGILSLCEIQMKIGEAEKYYSVEFFRWGPHCAENLFAKKNERKVHKIIPEKFHQTRLKMVLVFK